MALFTLQQFKVNIIHRPFSELANLWKVQVTISVCEWVSGGWVCLDRKVLNRSACFPFLPVSLKLQKKKTLEDGIGMGNWMLLLLLFLWVDFSRIDRVRRRWNERGKGINVDSLRNGRRIVGKPLGVLEQKKRHFSIHPSITAQHHKVKVLLCTKEKILVPTFFFISSAKSQVKKKNKKCLVVDITLRCYKVESSLRLHKKKWIKRSDSFLFPFSRLSFLLTERPRDQGGGGFFLLLSNNNRLMWWMCAVYNQSFVVESTTTSMR